jgi:hypothetical protein
MCRLPPGYADHVDIAKYRRAAPTELRSYLLERDLAVGEIQLRGLVRDAPRPRERQAAPRGSDLPAAAKYVAVRKALADPEGSSHDVRRSALLVFLDSAGDARLNGFRERVASPGRMELDTVGVEVTPDLLLADSLRLGDLSESRSSGVGVRFATLATWR